MYLIRFDKKNFEIYQPFPPPLSLVPYKTKGVVYGITQNTHTRSRVRGFSFFYKNKSFSLVFFRQQQEETGLLYITTVSCSQFIFRLLGSYLALPVAVTSVTIIVRKFEGEDRISRQLGIIIHQAHTQKVDR